MNIKRILSCIIISVTLLTLCACNPTDVESDSPKDGERILAVSIVPQATLVKKVCEDKFKVVTMIPSGASPETYEPTLKEMQQLEKAEIYFSIGVPAEEGILPSVSANTETVYLQNRISEKYPDREEDGGRDPHIWLSPKRMAVAVTEIAERLSEADPENAELYKSNAEDCINELSLLDRDIKALLESAECRSFMVFHPSFGYFADDYGLTMYALEEHGKEATAKRLAEMATFAKKEGISVIFYQAETSGRQAEAFAEEISGKAVALEPLAADYIGNLKKMATAISEAIN